MLLFFSEGSGHSVEMRTAPALTDPEEGHVRTPFELELTRFSAGGIREKRYLVVRIDVAKRNGTAELVDAVFGPLFRFFGR